MISYLIAVAICLVGMFLHWLKRYGRRQTDSNLWVYLKNFAGHTFMSLGSIFAAVGTAANAGFLDVSDAATVSNLLLGGYTIDSLINKDKQSFNQVKSEMDKDHLMGADYYEDYDE